MGSMPALLSLWSLWSLLLPACRPGGDTAGKQVEGSDTAAPDTATACGPAGTGGSPALVFDGAAPQNLLVISIDTLRRDRVGRYDPESVTPFLDGLMGESVVLDDMRGCSNWTLPGMMCVMSGQSTLDLGQEPVIPGLADELVPDDFQTLATWLTAAGWQTTLVTASYLFSDAYPLTNGFQQYVSEGEPDAAPIVDSAVEQFRRFDPDQPWYLHVHLRDPHAPYNPPPAYQGMLEGRRIGDYDPRTDGGILRIIGDYPTMSAEDLAKVRANVELLYRGEVTYLDDEMARLWQTLETEGGLQDTLVVVVADHGEQNFEHGAFQHNQHLYAEEGMIIGVFWSSSLTPTVFDGPVSQPDIAPTILHSLGVAAPEGVAAPTGRVIGTEPPDRVRLSTSVDRDGSPIHTVERNGFRLIYSWSGERHLYRYDRDPADTTDLYSDPENAEDIACLWESLRPAIAQVDAARAGVEPVNPE